MAVLTTMKLSGHCSICKLPPEQREALHTDRWVNLWKYDAIAKKYFPQRKVSNVQKALSRHFKYHFPVKDVVDEMIEMKLERNPSVPTLTEGERAIFAEEFKERVDVIKTLDRMMVTLMDRVNYLHDEWKKIHTATKCEKCGRDDTGPNLLKLLAVFRELREQAETVMKMRNPMDIVHRVAEKTFVTFVEEMTELYVTVLTEKSNLVKDSANEFLAGRINQAVFAKRLTEVLDDFGGDRIATAAQEKYRKIFLTAIKELKL